MKLSEAIRAGAKLGPQARGSLYQTVRSLFGTEKRSCALGAAFEAGKCDSHMEPVPKGTRGLRGEAGEGASQQLFHTPPEWNAVLVGTLECPQCERTDEGRYLIPHLNDNHKWTREEIALWVERLENSARRSTQIIAAPPPAQQQQQQQEEEWPEVVS